MQADNVPDLAKRARILMDKATGMPVIRRGLGVIDIRPGLKELKFYKAIQIPDVGVLVMMSDDAQTRFYLFSGHYRGSVLAYRPSCNTHEALKCLKGALGMTLEVVVSPTVQTFRNKVRDWLNFAIDPEPGLACCMRRMRIDRRNGLPISRQAAEGLGYLYNESKGRSWLIAPCVDTFLQGTVIAYFSFKVLHGIVAVISTGEMVNYVFLGNSFSPYSIVRARFKAKVTTEAEARVMWKGENFVSSVSAAQVIKIMCKDLETDPLLASFI